MGSPDSQKASWPNERPQHRVRITKPFYLGIHEVTQQQYEEVMGDKPWSGQRYVKDGPKYAATYVSWDDAQEFCRKLSTNEGRTCRLPTEAEWEYVCRAGSKTRYSFGDDESKFGDYAWYERNTTAVPTAVQEIYAHRVGLKRANTWGLYDMHGNVEEWCQDRHDDDYYTNSPTDDPTGAPSGSHREARGGGWNNNPGLCGSASRDSHPPDRRTGYLGFRVVLEVPE